MKKLNVVGLVGAKLDQPPKNLAAERWSAWRPSVAICQQQDLIVDRYDLVHSPHEKRLAEQVRQDITSVSPETKLMLHEVAFSDPWDFEEVYSKLHQLSGRLEFNIDTHDCLVHITTGTHVQQICLFLLTESRHLPGQLLQSSPASKRSAGSHQPGRYKIIDLDLSKYDELASRFSLEQKESLSWLKSGIETRDASFNALIEQIEKVTLKTTAPMLLTGPTGAGKSQLARQIYRLKRNRKLITGELVEVNCATLRGDAAMSALFGHTKGAFTGAAAARQGFLSKADQGILFLDEIGELGIDEQAMLLRAIEDKRFQPVGADHSVESNFQLIAGTNRDLQHAIANGRFREDLLARINMWTFCLPGLADRPLDIEPNLRYELDLYASTTGTRVSMNTEARRRFLKFALAPSSKWSANFRDLNAAVTRMATLANSGRISIEDVNAETGRLTNLWNLSVNASDSTPPVCAAVVADLIEGDLEALDQFDLAQLQHVIAVCLNSSSLSAAGRHLFQASRLQKKNPNDADRLRKYLARFGVTWSKVQSAQQPGK